MKITASLTKLNDSKADALIVASYADEPFNPALSKADQLLNGQITQLHNSKDFSSKCGEVLSLFANNSQRIILVGLGIKDKCGLSSLQTATTKAIKALVSTPAVSVSNYMTDVEFHNTDHATACKIISITASHAIYRYEATKNFKKDNKHSLDSMHVYASEKHDIDIKQASAIAQGVRISRELSNLPANICTPKYLAKEAKRISKNYDNCSVTVLNHKEMETLKMGALLAVGRGSRNKPKMIVLKYSGTDENQKPYVLVGKGVTFDTGGISLKPGASMDEMKYDMCGAAAVIGIFLAVAEIQLPINLIVIVPAVENMPGGNAYRPSDVITSYSGKTIEVINTDAEGRMILCDALTFAKEFDPQVLIDLATLTGACVIALGHVASVVMSKQTQLPQDIIQAGIDIHDRVWQLPLWDDYQEQINSTFADIQNIGGFPAGSITAGCFLSRFTEGLNWAHIDIAGSAWASKKAGATGRPVPMMVQYLINESQK